MSLAEEEVEGIDCSPCCRNEKFRFIIIALVLGQILSLCLCGTGVTSQFLSVKYGVNTPTTQNFVSYFLLCLVYGTMLAYKPTSSSSGDLINVFKHNWWKYALLAFIDVEANYFMVRAYQYTDLASIQLLDCFTIPVVLVLSFCFLHVRYRITHVLGIAICLIGIGCLVWGDIVNGKGEGGSNRLLGDLFCLAGAALYGVSNVVEEKLVKQYSRTEYLGMVGLFGSVISGIQLSIVDRENLSQVSWQRYEIILLYFAFAIFMLAFYSLVTVALQRTSAAMYNLSILSADFYTLLAGLYIFNFPFHYLYFISMFCVLLGSVVYSLKPTRLRSVCHNQATGIVSPPKPPIVGYNGTRNDHPSSVIGQDATGSVQSDVATCTSIVDGPVLNAAGVSINDTDTNSGVHIQMCKLLAPILTEIKSFRSSSPSDQSRQGPSV